MKLYKVKKSKIDNQGVYAARDIKAETKIIYYKGKLITKKETDRNPKYDNDFFGSDYLWGTISILLANFFTNKYVVIIFSFIGLVGLLFSTDILSLIKLKIKFKIPKLSFKRPLEPKVTIRKSEPRVSKKIIPDTHYEEIEVKASSTRKSRYTRPSLEILNNAQASTGEKVNKEVLKEDANFIEGIFIDFNIKIEVINIKVGPVITLYEVLPAPGIKINSIINLADDISRSMGATSVRIAQVYGTKFIGIEIPNKQREMVTIKELLASNEFKKTNHKIPISSRDNWVWKVSFY